MKNKWISILGASILTIGFTGCSGSADKADTPADKQDTSKVPAENEQSEQQSNESKGNKDNEKDKNKTENNQDPTITALVNKQNSLDETYAPTDLVKLEVPTVLPNPEINQLRKVAADALKDMFHKAKESDIHLYARSGYRSYQTQVQLFNNYAATHGEEAASRYSARAGQSEHQTGLSIDVTSESVNFQLVENFGETIEGKWLNEHAHEFGFIIRYPKGKEEITGYIFEPWHIRYLGIELATKVYESRLTYEEYLSKNQEGN